MTATPLPLPRPYLIQDADPRNPYPETPGPRFTPHPQLAPRPRFTPHPRPVQEPPPVQGPQPVSRPARPAAWPAPARQPARQRPARRPGRLARALIGDELRIPIMWCEFGTCIERYTHVEALGERDLRGRALAAGWRYDLLGRLACPSCVQHDETFWMTRPPVPAQRY